MAAFAPPGPAFDLFPFPFGPALPATFAGLTALLIGAALAARGLPRIAAAGFLLTAASLFGLSAAVVNVYFPSRGEVIVWPLLALAGFSLLQRRLKPLSIHLVMGALTLFLAAQAFLWLRALPDGSPWDGIARAVAARVRPVDRILVPGPWALSLEHYLRREGCGAGVEIIPADQAAHPGWYRCATLTHEDRLALAGAAAFQGKGSVFLFRDATQPCARAVAEELVPILVARFGPFVFERLAPADRPAAEAPGLGEHPPTTVD